MKFSENNDTFAADTYCSLSDMAEALFEDIWDDEEDEDNAEYDASAINRTVEKNIEDHARKLGQDWLPAVREKFIDRVKENIKQVNSANDLHMTSYAVDKIIDCLSSPDVLKTEYNNERNTVNITQNIYKDFDMDSVSLTLTFGLIRIFDRVHNEISEYCESIYGDSVEVNITVIYRNIHLDLKSAISALPSNVFFYVDRSRALQNRYMPVMIIGNSRDSLDGVYISDLLNSVIAQEDYDMLLFLEIYDCIFDDYILDSIGMKDKRIYQMAVVSSRFSRIWGPGKAPASAVNTTTDVALHNCTIENGNVDSYVLGLDTGSYKELSALRIENMHLDNLDIVKEFCENGIDADISLKYVTGIESIPCFVYPENKDMNICNLTFSMDMIILRPECVNKLKYDWYYTKKWFKKDTADTTIFDLRRGIPTICVQSDNKFYFLRDYFSDNGMLKWTDHVKNFLKLCISSGEGDANLAMGISAKDMAYYKKTYSWVEKMYDNIAERLEWKEISAVLKMLVTETSFLDYMFYSFLYNCLYRDDALVEDDISRDEFILTYYKA